MLALLMLMAASYGALAGGTGQQADFNATLKAAEQSDAEAQSTLGLMYAKGQGVAQDHGKAHAWFRKAAEQGFAQAQFRLGIMYANGAGGAQDFVKARTWFLKAAEQGHALGSSVSALCTEMARVAGRTMCSPTSGSP